MDLKVKISDHISYEEATESATAEKWGFENTPSDEVLEVMAVTAAKVFEPLRRFWKTPIWLSSFYRCPEVNKALKGAKDSQHMAGEAIDIDAQVYGVISNRQVFEYIRDNNTFDQLIWEEGDNNEPGWVHVSYRQNANRMEVLRKYNVKGKIKYVKL
jgi:hypothetical protein